MRSTTVKFRRPTALEESTRLRVPETGDDRLVLITCLTMKTATKIVIGLNIVLWLLSMNGVRQSNGHPRLYVEFTIVSLIILAVCLGILKLIGLCFRKKP